MAMDSFQMQPDESIIGYLKAHPDAHREEIRRGALPEASDTTVWRALRRLVKARRLTVHGRGPATRYQLAGAEAVRQHLKKKPRPTVLYQDSFLGDYLPGKTFFLPKEDRQRLMAAGSHEPLEHHSKHERRLMEKVMIDLAWASSSLEGNTYSLLDTERLIKYGERAQGKDLEEATMILNHKAAIGFIQENLDDIAIDRRTIMALHGHLAHDLVGNPRLEGALRTGGVGIKGSSYEPIQHPDFLSDEFDVMVAKAQQIEDPFEQSFFLLAAISYLQGFIDVNKRTGRISSNIPLLKAGLAPMSFVTMPHDEYVNGLYGVYELNNVDLLREVYVDGYLSSAENYKVVKSERSMLEKWGVTHKDFVQESIRHCVLEFKTFDAQWVSEMAIQSGVVESEAPAAVEYVERRFRGLHEGNVLRYRLKPEDLDGVTLDEGERGLDHDDGNTSSGRGR
jgi:hypothetical protein